MRRVLETEDPLRTVAVELEVDLIGYGTVLASFLISVYLFLDFTASGSRPYLVDYYDWISVGAMQIGSIIAIYVLFWTMTLFAVLPWHVRTAEEVGAEPVPGQADSAARWARSERIARRNIR